MLRRHGTAALLALAVLFLAITAAGLTLRYPADIGSLDFRREAIFIALVGAMGLVGVAAMALLFVRPVPIRHGAFIVVATGLLARLLVIGQPPLNSDDMYRYVWDGRVQAAGINPYRYLPSDPALAPLRDTVPGPTAIYPNINRATYAPTIYPPAAQLVFAMAGQLGSSIWTMKAVMLAFDLVTTAALLLTLRAAGRPLVHLVTWSWNPLVIWELINGGHVDGIAIAFTALAVLGAVRRRDGWAGLALGLAVISKFIPAITAPALWRPREGGWRSGRWNWLMPAAALLAVVAGYACYASAGRKVLGFLGGYATEEGLESGSGFLLVRLAERLAPKGLLALPHAANATYLALCLVLLCGLALLVLSRPLPLAPPARIARIGTDAALLTTMFFALLSPHYPWYLCLLVLPATLTPAQRGLAWTFPAWSVLWPVLSGPLLYLDFGRSRLWCAAIVFLGSLPLLAVDLWSRRTAAPASPQLR